MWNRGFVESVQITMAESFDVSDRGSFYDRVGCLRDVVQNHLMQVLAMVAMEPPSLGGGRDLRPQARRVQRDAERAARGLRAWAVRRLRQHAWRTDGLDNRDLLALRLWVDNWRWSGVPFLIRAGKSLPDSTTQVRIVFRQPPSLGFVSEDGQVAQQNVYVLDIDPRAGVRFLLQTRSTNADTDRSGVELDVDLSGDDVPTPYQALLHAAMVGDQTMFTREDVVEETGGCCSRSWTCPRRQSPKPGTWGPEAADALVADLGGWHGPWA